VIKKLKTMIMDKIVSKGKFLSFGIRSKLDNNLEKSNVSKTIIEENMSIDEIIKDIKNSPAAIDGKKCKNAEPGSELAKKIDIALNGNKK